MSITLKGVFLYFCVGIEGSIEALQFDVTFYHADSLLSGQASDSSTIQGGYCSSNQECRYI